MVKMSVTIPTLAERQKSSGYEAPVYILQLGVGYGWETGIVFLSYEEALAYAQMFPDLYRIPMLREWRIVATRAAGELANRLE